MLGAACCLGYFGFMWAGKFTAVNPSIPAPINVSDAVVNSYSSPSMVRVFLRRAKSDPFNKGISIYLNKTNSSLCPITAVLHYLAVHRPGEGHLFIHKSGSPLTREQFIRGVKAALSAAQIAHQNYSGCSFVLVPPQQQPLQVSRAI